MKLIKILKFIFIFSIIYKFFKGVLSIAEKKKYIRVYTFEIKTTPSYYYHFLLLSPPPKKKKICTVNIIWEWGMAYLLLFIYACFDIMLLECKSCEYVYFPCLETMKKLQIST